MVFSVFSDTLLFLSGISSVAVSIRAFYMYSVTPSQRLFTAGLAMAIAAVGIVCSALNGSPLLPGMNLEWAWYFGTSIGFLFLVVGSLMTTEEQFTLLKRWEVIAAAVIITMIALTPVLPAFTNPIIPVTLDVFRIIVCVLGFFRYLRLYTANGTRFSLLMCLAFLFIAASYGILMPQLFSNQVGDLSTIGTVMRITGDIILFVAFLLG